MTHILYSSLFIHTDTKSCIFTTLDPAIRYVGFWAWSIKSTNFFCIGTLIRYHWHCSIADHILSYCFGTIETISW